MNCLIIGYGSIGSRHASILSQIGHDIFVVSKRDIESFLCYRSISEAFENEKFRYVIISNETCNHYKSFVELNELGYSGKLLIEKPVFLEPHPIDKSSHENIFVAYNLRFHPVIQDLYRLLNGKQIYSINVYVGQYLPSWRPGTDYTKCYSSFREEGGGSLRDLSHELDYINWIAGGWKRVAAIGGKYSDLQTDSDDVFALLLEMGNCPIVSLQMNYLDRKPRREIIINLKGKSIKADLIENTIEINGETISFTVDRNLTYRLLHETILAGNYDTVCTLEQGLDVLKLICAAESAAEKKTWILK